MDIVTSSHFIVSGGPGRVAISRSVPRGNPKGFRVLRELAPGPWFKSVSPAEYLDRYRAQLARLDPRAVVSRIEQAAQGAKRAVLQCWEDNVHDEWQIEPGEHRDNCHRRIVAAWLQETIGLTVAELPARPIVDLCTANDGWYASETPASEALEGDTLDRGFELGERKQTGTLADYPGGTKLYVLEPESQTWWPVTVLTREPSKA